MLGCQWLPVHLPGQQGILMEPFLYRQRPLKIRHLAERDVRSIHQ